MRLQLAQNVERGRAILGAQGSWPGDRSGLFRLDGPCRMPLLIIASDGSDEIRWEHVSVSARSRCPNWDEMCWVKDLFWSEEECVIQYHPPRSEYVNMHQYVLHLWKPLDFQVPLPPSIAVGIKGVTLEVGR